MSKAAKLNLLIIIVLAVIVSASIYWLKHRHTNLPVTAPPILVQLGSPQEILIPNTVTSTGNLQAIQTTNLSAKIAGYVTNLHYQEGEHVKKGMLLIQLDKRKEQAAVASAKAQDAISALKYQQSSKIYQRHLEAYDDYFSAKITHQKDNAALETAQTDLADKSIHAPFAGVVGAKLISIGDYVQPGATLVTLTNVNKLRVTYALPATYLDALKLNQPVTLTTPTLNNSVFHGYVSYIAPTIDTNSQTITVHADINNKQDKLKPGLFVNIQQQLGAPTQTTVIPANTLFASLQGYYVLGVKNNKAYKIPVKIGRKLQQQVEIKSGLALGDRFIVQGQTKVQVGGRVIMNTSTRH